MEFVPELERMKSLKYQDGKAYLEEHPTGSTLFERLQEDCPHVDPRELVSLFHLRNEELIVATAHRLEYNATHRPEVSELGRM